MSGDNLPLFNAPEFSKIFKRIAEKENKHGFFCVRQLNKFHAAQFEERIDSGQVNIQNLRSFAISKFSDQIRNLTVRIPGHLMDLSDLCHASGTFLSNVQKVNVIFTQGQQSQRKIIIISQPLIFRGLNVLENYRGHHIFIRCNNNDVQIIDSNFDGIGLKIIRANKLIVQNSSFRNVFRFNTLDCGLNCSQTQNMTTIDNVKFFNCSLGLFIGGFKNQVSLKKIYAEKCTHGCCFYNQVFGEIILNDSEIVDCGLGIQFTQVNNSIVQNCNITGAKKIGIYLNRSFVKYRHVFVHQSADGVDGEFQNINLDEFSTFTEIL